MIHQSSHTGHLDLHVCGFLQITNIVQVYGHAEYKNTQFKDLAEGTCHSRSVKGVGVLSFPAELLSIFSDVISKPAIT